MNKKNGFAPIVAIVILAAITLIAGGGFYYASMKKSGAPKEQTLSGQATSTNQGPAAASGFTLPSLTVIGTQVATTTIVATPSQPPIGVVKDCKADINCLITSAVACRPAVATIISKTTISSLTATTKTAHTIKGVDAGSCSYEAKTIDLTYTSKDASAAGKKVLAQVKESAAYVIGTVQSCRMSAKELVKRLNAIKKGTFSRGVSDPYCTSGGAQSQTQVASSTLFVELGGTLGSTVGQKNVSVSYKSATDASATLVVTVDSVAKTITFDMDKEVVFSGVGLTVVSIKPSSVFPKEKQIGLQLAEKK